MGMIGRSYDIEREPFMKPNRRAILVGLSRMAAASAAAAVTMPQEARAAEPAKATLPPGAQSAFGNVNGIRMHYVSAGEGPLVLLLHGWPQTWFAWHGIIPRLASRYRVVAPDLRGSGLSELTPGGYDKQTIAEDLRGLIAHLGYENAHVVGHDMGGKAAYVLAHLHPQSVSKLVLADCLVPGSENMDAASGGAWHYGFHMSADFPEMLTKGREREYIEAQIRAWCHIKTAITAAAIDEYASHYARPGGMTAGFNYYRALREDAAFAAPLRGTRLAMPVMAVTGRHGVGTKLAEALASEADPLVQVVIEESGHFVAEEAPDQFFAALDSFLAG